MGPGIHGPKPVDPGPVPAKFRNLGPDQDQQNFENPGPIPTVRGSLFGTAGYSIFHDSKLVPGWNFQLESICDMFDIRKPVNKTESPFE